MDPVTHVLAGATLAHTRLGAGARARTAAVLMAASLAPDIDVAWLSLSLGDAVLSRRTYTHSLVGIGALALLAALVLRPLVPGRRFRSVVGLCLVAIAVHVALDLLNSFGVGLFYPFSGKRVELPLLFIVDPVLLVLLSAPALLRLTRHGRQWSQAAAHTAVAGVAMYSVFCGAMRLRASHLLTIESQAERTDGEWTYLVPEPLAPFFWKGVYPSGGGYAEALITPLNRGLRRLPPIPSSDEDESVALARRADVSRDVVQFLTIPVWEAHDGFVLAHDRRFRFALLGNRWDPFTFRFRVENGRVQRVDWTLGEYVNQGDRGY